MVLMSFLTIWHGKIVLCILFSFNPVLDVTGEVFECYAPNS